MDVAIGKRWEPLLEELVGDGSYTSVEEVVAEGLRLVQLRNVKLAALRETIQASIARGGSFTSEEMLAHVDAHLAGRKVLQD